MSGSTGTQLVYGQLGGASRVHVEGDGIHVSDEAELDRVHLGQLASGDYGLRVTNPGGTVIIDGTSNMFKIVASGAMSRTNPGPAGTYQSEESTVTLTGLGAQATVPAHLSFVGSTILPTDHRFGFDNTVMAGAVVYGALASGGSADYGHIVLLHAAQISTTLDGSDQCVVRLKVQSVQAADTTHARYAVLKEAAL